MRVGAASIPLNPDSPLASLLDAPGRPGIVRWIGLRPARGVPMQAVRSVALDVAEGLIGDRWQGRPGGNRQVTVIAAESLPAIASFLGLDDVPPAVLRRNFLVSGINLMALKGCRVRFGAAELDITGDCHPCSRMEAALGPGGYNAMRGHGGVTARVVTPGHVRLGDTMCRAPGASAGG